MATYYYPSSQSFYYVGNTRWRVTITEVYGNKEAKLKIQLHGENIPSNTDCSFYFNTNNTVHLFRSFIASGTFDATYYREVVEYWYPYTNISFDFFLTGIASASTPKVKFSPMPYTVSFNTNGGSSTPSSITGTYNRSITMPTQSFTKTGYNFLGWSMDKAATTPTYEAGETYYYDIYGNATLYAVWEPVGYEISFDANGGSGEPESQIKYYGTVLKLSSVIPTRKGYTFVGWSTSKSSTKVSYYAGGNYTPNASATLYAVWKAISYKVTYNGNSGTSEVHGEEMSDTATYGQDYSTKANMFEKLGYEFIGWNEKADGTGTDWTEKIGTPFAWNYTSNIVLYAQWEIKANCRVKEDGKHKLGMMYVKNNGKYYPCIVSKKVDGTYKSSTIT